jgi:hypothetical protein
MSWIKPMARDHARIKTSIWRDPDFRDLTMGSQWLYITILSQEKLSRAGVIDYRPGRIAALAKGHPASRVEADTLTLQRGRFILVDKQTEELFVRSYIRHDGVLDRVNMGKSVARALAEVVSFKIRSAAIDELSRLYIEQPNMPGFEGIGELYPEVMEQVLAMASTIPLPMASGVA